MNGFFSDTKVELEENLERVLLRWILALAASLTPTGGESCKLKKCLGKTDRGRNNSPCLLGLSDLLEKNKTYPFVF